MGITRATIKFLMREGKREKLLGNVLTAGRQDIWATNEDIRKWSREMDFQLKNTKVAISEDKYLKEMKYVTDETFFLSLGFDSVDSIDCSDYEGSTIVHDLNEDIPENLQCKFDLIFDGGTSEHIFNFPKVLENYNKMLKVGGRIIHGLPSSNCVDHGFYMFSPTLFFDYYTANKWNIIDSLFVQFASRNDRKKWKFYSYKPGCLDRYSFGGFNKGISAVFFIVKKEYHSTFNASVQQGACIKTWNTLSNDQQEIPTKQSFSLYKRIKKIIPKRIKVFIYNLIISKIPKRFYLKLVAKY